MGAKPSCEMCQDDGADYNNPLIKFLHIGKYNNRIWCLSCLMNKTILYEKDYLYPIIEIK